MTWSEDAIERVFWTAVQVGLAAVAVDQIGLPEWAIVPVGAVLALVKAWVAKHVGDPNTAAFE